MRTGLLRGRKTEYDMPIEAWCGHHTSTTVLTFRPLDVVGHGFNLLIELPPVTGKVNDSAHFAR